MPYELCEFTPRFTARCSPFSCLVSRLVSAHREGVHLALLNSLAPLLRGVIATLFDPNYLRGSVTLLCFLALFIFSKSTVLLLSASACYSAQSAVSSLFVFISTLHSSLNASIYLELILFSTSSFHPSFQYFLLTCLFLPSFVTP